MKTIIVDPFPRQMDLIFSKDKLVYLKKNFKLIDAPIKNKKNFYQNNISKADFIIGQPDLPNSILKKAAKLKAIFNVESNFLDNMDYEYCFRNGIYVLSTAPVLLKQLLKLQLVLLYLSRGKFINHI